jgi:DNA transposition AAA+ family ATPase
MSSPPDRPADEASLVGDAADFIVTKEYRRFAEFCDACRRYRYIGLCYGPPGVGKTLSARRYAHWDVVEPLLGDYFPAEERPLELTTWRTILYTPTVTNTPKQIENELGHRCLRLTWLIEEAEHPDTEVDRPGPGSKVELVLVDEADRLKMPGPEQLRDMYDRGTFGLILIGMPGIEKRLARYPQLYSRVGFVHPFRALSAEEVRFILKEKWRHLGLLLRPDDFADTQAVAAIIRITGGNFRLLHRLLTQIERVLQINDLHLVTEEVVDAARESLVIGVV